ncbi:MAG: class F sortase [Candidatus Saccharimonadales bacterium]
MKRPPRYKRLLHLLLWLLAGIVLIAGAWLAMALYFAPPAATPQAIRQPKSDIAASSVPPKTPEVKRAYSVPADHPRELIIKRLGIDTNILSMGTLSDGTLAAPATAWDVGWYNQSSLPGTGEGALLIDGHVNDALGTPGIFYRLHDLQTGDTIQIERGDKQLLTYSIVKVDQVPVDQVDMTSMMRSVTPGTQGLNLITCGGTYNQARKTYDDRILVYAVLEK